MKQITKLELVEKAREFERLWMDEHQLPFKYSHSALYHKMADFALSLPDAPEKFNLKNNIYKKQPI